MTKEELEAMKTKYEAYIEAIRNDYLPDIKAALGEKEVTVTGDLTISEIAGYIDKIGA